MACKRSAVRSRVAPPSLRMNGRQNHSFSTEFGVIAQLGERLHGMQEVRGSIPRSSTKFRVTTVIHTNRGYSSAGRALAWHARGPRFDPA
ncbi:conserved hypothetical protein [Aeromonas veronii]|uniref:Uncharacterized protein n=1 Tax=Aeromonas veronii TaxID=654 RepID=A0A653L5E0_AERVE|nr:conserved hypothetical protein [Aeromonas veronii]